MIPQRCPIHDRYDDCGDDREQRAPLLPVGAAVTFNSRRGYVCGYWTGRRHGHASEVQTFYVIEYDPESRGYVMRDRNDVLDCFASMGLVDVENIDNDGKGN